MRRNESSGGAEFAYIFLDDVKILADQWNCNTSAASMAQRMRRFHSVRMSFSADDVLIRGAKCDLFCLIHCKVRQTL